MLRIPLLYRPAGGTGRAVEGKGWASLIDVAPTLLKEAGMNGMSVPSAVPLQDIIDAPRPAPAFAVSDGLVWNHLKKAVPVERKPEFDRIRVVAYAEEWKLVYDATRNETQAYDLSTDPGELRDRWGDTPEFVTRLRATAGEIGERMTQSRPVPLAPDIEERLRGWGYV
jgi:arylsulfatase A-like enzyme